MQLLTGPFILEWMRTKISDRTVSKSEKVRMWFTIFNCTDEKMVLPIYFSEESVIGFAVECHSD